MITSFVSEFKGSDALIECTMVDTAGTQLSRCAMTVAHVDKATLRATAWPPQAWKIGGATAWGWNKVAAALVEMGAEPPRSAARNGAAAATR